ncbi:hypothetical protein B0H14DRAFT_2395551, partial [Mycena olivaceomarginata]
CVIPCVKGLLAEDEDNEILLDLLYDVATIQAFAKMRVHVDFTLEVVDKMITSLGSKFQDEVCSKYNTCELPKEAAPRAAQEAQSEARALNVNTYKHHAMGDYVSYIRQYGTLGSYSTITVCRTVAWKYSG